MKKLLPGEILVIEKLYNAICREEIRRGSYEVGDATITGYTMSSADPGKTIRFDIKRKGGKDDKKFT